MLRYLKITFLLIFHAGFLFSQQVHFGLSVGNNLSLISVRSDYTLSDYSYTPLIGFSAGLVTRTVMNEKVNLEGGLLFSVLRSQNNSTTLFRNGLGDVTGIVSKKNINNNYIQLRFNPDIRIIKNLYLGSGINLNILLSSKTRYLDYQQNLKLKNYHYNPVGIHIPLFVSVDVESVNLNLGFSKAIGSRLKDKASSIEEMENYVYFEAHYFFNR
jgi:hypothetical protein